MTAEVIVANKQAVALAADSAATVGPAIYQTANKLFTLDKVHPVGVMVSNVADFLETPWEVLVKVYRQERLGCAPKGTVKEYAEDFLNWVLNNKVCNEERQSRHISYVTFRWLRQVRDAVDHSIYTEIQRNGKCLQRRMGQIAKDHLEGLRNYLAAFADYGFTNLTSYKLARDYKDALNLGIDMAFNQFPLTVEARKMAWDCAKMSVMKELQSPMYSEVAFVGFGEDEYFPSIHIYKIDGAIDGEMKIDNYGNAILSSLTHVNSAVVFGLAQRDMVERFMNGVDSDYSAKANELFAEFCNMTLKMNPSQAKVSIDHFESSLEKFVHERFSSPILDSVNGLPKEELAGMAEALVNLTSVKRRVSANEEETVGGPVDVAIITKGDGFVWIKRKYYFASELNQHFNSLYLQGKRQ